MKRVITLSIVLSVFIAGFGALLPAVSTSVNAQDNAQRQACIGSGGNWQNGECVDDQGSRQSIEGIVNMIINVLLSIAGAIAVIMLIIGGFRYLVSGGDSSAVEGAKKTIMYAIIGLVVIFLSYAAVNFVIGGLTGDNQQQNPGEEETTEPPDTQEA